jgi:G3E family GTPase
VVNDFGAINIDAELVVGIDGNVISLANGCVCCTLRDDLVATVLETIELPEKPEYILLETSGVAEPTGIAVTFNNPDLRQCIRLDSILCVVDAEQVFGARELMELKIYQMACADMIVLNKVDLVDRGQIARIRAWLDSRFHRYRLVESSHCDVPLAVLLAVGRLDPTTADGDEHAHNCGCTDLDCRREHGSHDHSTSFGTWSFETDRPLSLQALREAASRLPANIYRAKGVIYAADAPERRAVLQVVGRRVDISLQDNWGTRPRRTRIVAIGAPEALGNEALRERFEQCIEAGERVR